MCPEVLRTSGGADAPAVVALRAPLHNFAVPNLNLRPLIEGVEEREDPGFAVRSGRPPSPLIGTPIDTRLGVGRAGLV